MDLMNLSNTIDNLCQVHGISCQKAFLESGVGKDFGGRIRKGICPSIEKVAALADFFGVSIDYLVTGQEENPVSESFTETELELLGMIRRLDDFDKGRIYGMLETILNGEKYQKGQKYYGKAAN